MVSKNQTISPWALAVLIIPLLVLTGTELMLGFWGDTGVQIPTDVTDKTVLLELSARYRAMAAFVFFATVALAVTAVFFADVFRRFTRGSQVKIVGALILTILVSMIFSVLEPEELKSFETYELLGKDLFLAALEPGRTGACFPDRATCKEGTAFDAMVAMIDLSNHFVSLAAASVLTGIILSLAHGPKKPTKIEGRAHDLREARRVAKRYLYCAGVLLTAGMVWVQAWMMWPSTLIADEATRREFVDMVNAFSLFRGTTFSLLILSVYLPVNLALAMRFETFWREVPLEASLAQDETLERISYTEALKTVTAIVAPILVGVVGSTWSVSFGL